jgi:hypothetical protein
MGEAKAETQKEKNIRAVHIDGSVNIKVITEE